MAILIYDSKTGKYTPRADGKLYDRCRTCAHYKPMYTKEKDRCYHGTDCGACMMRKTATFGRTMTKYGEIVQGCAEACREYRAKNAPAVAQPLTATETAALGVLIGKLASAYTAGAATR